MVFKIGNNKELPPISYHLLEHCKDFIRKWSISWSNVSWAFATPVHKGRTQCRESATRTRDLPVTGGKILPLAPGPPFLQHLFIQNGISFEKSVAPNPLEHMADILKTKAQGATWILLFSFDSSAQNWYSEPMQFKSTKVCPYPKFTLHLFYNVYSFTHLCRIKLL